MGKASKLKKIRKIAAKLPVINRNTREYHIVKGVDLIEDYGSDQNQDGSMILADKTYKVAMPVITEINHNRALKRNYNKHGIAGIRGYAQAVINHDAKMKLANV